MPAGQSAWTPLANVTLSSTATSVTFSSISQLYKDLVLVCRFNGFSNSAPGIRMNGDTGSNYVTVNARGNGSSGSSWAFGDSFIYMGDYSSNPVLCVANIFDYSTTDKNKAVLVTSGPGATYSNMLAGRWANTSAMTSLTIVRSESQTIASGSSFTLYGVSA